MATNAAPTLSTGRRKESVARVRLVSGTGSFELNGRPLEEYFTTRAHRMTVTAPLRLVGRERTSTSSPESTAAASTDRRARFASGSRAPSSSSTRSCAANSRPRGSFAATPARRSVASTG